jgi:hypothetical protein
LKISHRCIKLGKKVIIDTSTIETIKREVLGICLLCCHLGGCTINEKNTEKIIKCNHFGLDMSKVNIASSDDP